MLSETKYALLCVLGMEVFYVVCLAYGSFLSDKAQELHHALFELIPRFVWGNPVSMVWGAVYMGVLAWIAGWYIAWMHNASIITGEK
jgi:Na+/serine symporter